MTVIRYISIIQCIQIFEQDIILICAILLIGNWCYSI